MKRETNNIMTSCPFTRLDVATDPSVVPLPLAVASCLLTGLLLPAYWWWKHGSKIRTTLANQYSSDHEINTGHGQIQILAGLHMLVAALPMGLVVPHVLVPKTMLQLHSISILQGAILLAYGAVWSKLGLSHTTSRVAMYLNLYGFYVNCLGMLWGILTDSRDLLYMTRMQGLYQDIPRSEAAERVLRVALQSQGLANIVGLCLMLGGMCASGLTGRPLVKAKPRGSF